MIDLITAAGIGGIIGFGTCAVLTMGKVSDADRNADILERVEDNLLAQIKSKQGWITRAYNAENAHARAADALATTTRRLEKIRELADTPQTLRKADVRAVLDGEV